MDVVQQCEKVAMEEDLQCPICWEAIEQAISLPCRCRVDYCGGCWDRSLAQSFNACGQARCPTCRTPVRVDFEASTGQLVFTKEDQALPEEEVRALPLDVQCRVVAERQRRARERLVQQAKPVQVEILRAFGKARPWLRGSEAEEEATRPERCARAAAAPPRCVCGGLLERLSSDERVRRVLRRHLPDVAHGTPQFEQSVARVIVEGVTFCSCDLCLEDIKPPGFIWTCENGNQTIFHANAYDICEQCFLRHASGAVEAPSPATPQQ